MSRVVYSDGYFEPTEWIRCRDEDGEYERHFDPPVTRKEALDWVRAEMKRRDDFRHWQIRLLTGDPEAVA